MKRPKLRYRAVRIQDLKPLDIVYDEHFNRHIMVEMSGVYQEGTLEGVPVWKFKYRVVGVYGLITFPIAYAPENTQVFIRVRDLNFNENPF